MAALPRAQGFEHILLDQVEDGDPALLLDIGVALEDRGFIELDMADARLAGGLVHMSV
jgi:hypothetical protein